MLYCSFASAKTGRHYACQLLHAALTYLHSFLSYPLVSPCSVPLLFFLLQHLMRVGKFVGPRRHSCHSVFVMQNLFASRTVISPQYITYLLGSLLCYISTVYLSYRSGQTTKSRWDLIAIVTALCLPAQTPSSAQECTSYVMTGHTWVSLARFLRLIKQPRVVNASHVHTHKS